MSGHKRLRMVAGTIQKRWQEARRRRAVRGSQGKRSPEPTLAMQTCQSNRGNAPEGTSRLLRSQPDPGIGRRFATPYLRSRTGRRLNATTATATRTKIPMRPNHRRCTSSICPSSSFRSVLKRFAARCICVLIPYFVATFCPGRTGEARRGRNATCGRRVGRAVRFEAGETVSHGERPSPKTADIGWTGGTIRRSAVATLAPNGAQGKGPAH